MSVAPSLYIYFFFFALQNGGTYSKDLDYKVTHLVCRCSAKQGEKYKLAVKLNIPIVNSKWIFMCDERQVRLDEAGFSVRDGMSYTHITLPLSTFLSMIQDILFFFFFFLLTL